MYQSLKYIKTPKCPHHRHTVTLMIPIKALENEYEHDNSTNGITTLEVNKGGLQTPNHHVNGPGFPKKNFYHR